METRTFMLQQYLPFTVLKLIVSFAKQYRIFQLQQYLPFMVLKHEKLNCSIVFFYVLQQYLPFTVLKRFDFGRYASLYLWLQQYLPFTVCAEGCKTAEEQSDDEVRTSQVPERSEGKTRVIRQQYLLFMIVYFHI